jgi:hypothetical protein
MRTINHDEFYTGNVVIKKSKALKLIIIEITRQKHQQHLGLDLSHRENAK